MKMNKLMTGLIAGLAAAALLSSCQTSKKDQVVNDCSGIFETRYVDNDRAISTKVSKQQKSVKRRDGSEKTVEKTEERTTHRKGEMKNSNRADMQNAEEKPATECKVLEVKLDSKTKCEFVGSDKIDSLSKILSENRNNKIILITPEDKLRDLTDLAQRYLTAGFDVKKHFDSDLFKGMNFPYKGMRCMASGVEYTIWTGDKKVILTVGQK